MKILQTLPFGIITLLNNSYLITDISKLPEVSESVKCGFAPPPHKLTKSCPNKPNPGAMQDPEPPLNMTQ
jgi:hypothetical protein